MVITKAQTNRDEWRTFAKIAKAISTTTKNLARRYATKVVDRHIRVLDLSWMFLETIPEEVGELVYLQHLNLNNNRISNLRTIPKLSIATLEIRMNALTSVGSYITNLPQLEVLDAQENRIKSISEDIHHLRSLRFLDLGINPLGQIPAQLCNVPRLEELHLNDCDVKRTEGLFEAPELLRVVNLSGNTVDKWPPFLVQTTNLEVLNLNGNNIRVLPPEVGLLTNLRELHMVGNLVESLPPQIGNLGRLTTLDLTDNRLHTLPPEIGNLKTLWSLDLGFNRIHSLPIDVARLTGLRKLILFSNRLQDIPAGMVDLRQLHFLDLRSNPEMQEWAKAAGSPSPTPENELSVRTFIQDFLEFYQHYQPYDTAFSTHEVSNPSTPERCLLCKQEIGPTQRIYKFTHKERVDLRGFVCHICHQEVRSAGFRIVRKDLHMD